MILQQAIPPTQIALKASLFGHLLSIWLAIANIPINEMIANIIRNVVIIDTNLIPHFLSLSVSFTASHNTISQSSANTSLIDGTHESARPVFSL